MTSTLNTALHRFASPAQFMRLARYGLPISILAALAALAYGFYGALITSPADYQQGEFVRIMYIHVPSAWLATLVYGAMVMLSIIYLVWKHTLADVMAREMAAVGACFTLIALITGALWGKPMWGAYWVWDARLTSFLLLFFLYVGYMMIAHASNMSERTRVSAAWLCIVGGINLPIIKFSVEWWNTLHQPASILRAGGSSIHSSMLTPLLACIAGFTLLALALLFARTVAALNEQKIRRLQRQMMLAKTRASERWSEEGESV